MQIWRPDTCACVIEEDTAGGSKKLNRVIAKCPAHASVSDVALYDVLYAGPQGENKRKNQMEAYLVSQADYGQAATATDGSITRGVKPGVGIAWQWTGTGADRVLTVSITGVNMTAQRRQAIQAFIDASPHAGRIVLT